MLVQHRHGHSLEDAKRLLHCVSRIHGALSLRATVESSMSSERTRLFE
jgi:hypothetical protein